MQNAEAVLGILRTSLESRMPRNWHVRFGGRPRGKGPLSGAPRRVADPTQTLQAFIAAHRDRCATAEQLETILVQQYQSWYNYHRANQALGRETTPADVYETIQKVFPVGDPITPTSPAQQPAQSSLTAGSSAVASRKVSARGSIPYGNRVIAVGRALTGQQIRLIEHPERLEFYNHEGTHLATLDWPTPMRNATVVKQIRTVY